MSVLSDNYKKIVLEVEDKIKDPEELDFVKQKITELSVMFMDIIDNLTNATDEKIKKLETKQQAIENKIQEVESFMSDMENDMLDEIEEVVIDSDDNDEYEFEIVCPYCNKEFITDINGKNEITCPECNNDIELDWNDEEESEKHCQGNGCTSCPGCGVDHKKNNKEENEDDM